MKEENETKYLRFIFEMKFEKGTKKEEQCNYKILLFTCIKDGREWNTKLGLELYKKLVSYAGDAETYLTSVTPSTVFIFLSPAHCLCIFHLFEYTYASRPFLSLPNSCNSSLTSLSFTFISSFSQSPILHHLSLSLSLSLQSTNSQSSFSLLPSSVTHTPTTVNFPCLSRILV